MLYTNALLIKVYDSIEGESEVDAATIEATRGLRQTFAAWALLAMKARKTQSRLYGLEFWFAANHVGWFDDDIMNTLTDAEVTVHQHLTVPDDKHCRTEIDTIMVVPSETLALCQFELTAALRNSNVLLHSARFYLSHLDEALALPRQKRKGAA